MEIGREALENHPTYPYLLEKGAQILGFAGMDPLLKEASQSEENRSRIAHALGSIFLNGSKMVGDLIEAAHQKMDELAIDPDPIPMIEIPFPCDCGHLFLKQFLK